MELASLLKIVLLIPTEDSKGTSKTVPSNKEGNQRISRRLSRENSPPKFKWFKFSAEYHRLEIEWNYRRYGPWDSVRYDGTKQTVIHKL